ncbi:MAG: DUF6090 family protein [Woeseiaceae bacterium]
MFRLSKDSRGGRLLLEILMIVIGINVALWFESWFQDLEEAETAERYLADLREDLVTDVGNLDVAIKSGEAKSERIARISEQLPTLDELPPEDLAQTIYTPPSYSFFVPSDFTYRSMQESGDFRLLRNEDIKKGILRLDRRHKDIAELQQNFLQALDEGYLPLMMNGFDIATMRVTDPTLLDDQLFRNFFIYTGQDTAAMVGAYRRARSESEELITLIDAALAD